MNQETTLTRREKIINFLTVHTEPLSATFLAKSFHVSRQVIVGDIALLRASGINIFATPKGYILKDTDNPPLSFEFIGIIACKHLEDNLLNELYTIVDFGGCVIDVTIEHSAYGQIKGELDIRCRLDADDFLKKLTDNKVRPLSNLTSGIHLHSIGCKDEKTFHLIVEALADKGIAME